MKMTEFVSTVKVYKSNVQTVVKFVLKVCTV